MADRKVFLEAKVRIVAWVDEGVDDMAAVAAFALNNDLDAKPEDHDLPSESVQIEDVQIEDVQVEDSK